MREEDLQVAGNPALFYQRTDESRTGNSVVDPALSCSKGLLNHTLETVS